MKKFNLILLAFVIVLASAVVLFISTTYAEDTKPTDMKVEKDKIKNPCGDLNCGTGKPCHCGEKCMCSAMKKDQGEKGMSCAMMGKSDGKMDMGKGMMCPMMQKKMEGGMQMGNMPMMGSIVDQIMANADKIQFTQDQKDKLNNLVLTHRKDMIKKKADLDMASIDLEGLMNKETPDLKVVADQFKKVSGLDADLKYSEFEFNVNIKALLTKEQKDTLKIMMNRNDQMGMKMDMPMGKPGESAPKSMPAVNPHKDHKDHEDCEDCEDCIDRD
jgi:Spy/CpxP family protein refolding chaperone